MFYMRPQECSGCGLIDIVNGTEVPETCSDSCDNFRSIPSTLYLAVLMLTGQGGPDGKLDPLTKVVCSLTAIFSVAVFAIPASMLTWGFEAEAERLMGKQRERRKRIRDAKERGLKVPESSETSEEDASGNSSWDEYEATILGDEEEKEKEEAKEKAEREELTRAIRRICDNCDRICGHLDDGHREPTKEDAKKQNRSVDARLNDLEAKVDEIHAIVSKLALPTGK